MDPSALSLAQGLKMSLAKSKISIGLYDLNNNLIGTYVNQVELSNYLNLNKSIPLPLP
jgi:hypothetical protein